MISHKIEVLDEFDSKVEIALEKIGLRAETQAKKNTAIFSLSQITVYQALNHSLTRYRINQHFILVFKLKNLNFELVV